MRSSNKKASQGWGAPTGGRLRSGPAELQGSAWLRPSVAQRFTYMSSCMHHSHIIAAFQPHTVLPNTHAPTNSIILGGRLAVRGTAGAHLLRRYAGPLRPFLLSCWTLTGSFL